MGYFLFILATATLFLRPQDFVAELAAVYLALLLACAIVACPSITAQLSVAELGRRPITFCVLGMGLAILLSHLSHLLLWEARTKGTEFAKVALFYLLFMGVVNTAARYRGFLSWLLLFILGITLAAILQYHEVISLPQLAALEQFEVNDETGAVTSLTRLRSIGLFNDPNDLCLVLLIGMGTALYRLGGRGPLLLRLPCLAALAFCGYALALTQSRGGFLAMLLGMLVLFRSRYGLWKTVLLAALALPVLWAVFAGRQTSFVTSTDTGQDRIQLWSEALQLFKQAPLFGIGQGSFQDEVGLVAHNSFVHCYAELGFFGGTLFVGAFFTALVGLHRLGRKPDAIADPELRRLLPYVTAIVAGYATMIMTLSRAYVVPTYLVLALVSQYLVLAGNAQGLALPRMNLRFLRQLTMVSACYLAATYVFVRLTVNRG